MSDDVATPVEEQELRYLSGYLDGVGWAAVAPDDEVDEFVAAARADVHVTIDLDHSLVDYWGASRPRRTSSPRERVATLQCSCPGYDRGFYDETGRRMAPSATPSSRPAPSANGSRRGPAPSGLGPLGSLQGGDAGAVACDAVGAGTVDPG